MVWDKYESKDTRKEKRCIECDEVVVDFIMRDYRCLECIINS